jgi:hypothetical protein
VTYRIRDRDIRLARSTRHFPKFLNRRYEAKDLLEVSTADVKSMGYTIVKKSSSLLRLSKFTTTYLRQIRVGSGWDEYSTGHKAATMTHEGGHGRQWRYYRPARFAFMYLAYPRFRWAMEMQGYSLSIWCYHAMGYDDKAIAGFIDRRAKGMRASYSLRAIHAGDFERRTREVLTSAWNDAQHAIK